MRRAKRLAGRVQHREEAANRPAARAGSVLPPLADFARIADEEKAHRRVRPPEAALRAGRF
jgi:hypothetical protein